MCRVCVYSMSIECAVCNVCLIVNVVCVECLLKTCAYETPHMFLLYASTMLRPYIRIHTDPDILKRV